MRDMIVDWCYEGGCTYLSDTSETEQEVMDTTELEELYREPCLANFD